jgi:parallel beta-helix repeat protein
MIHLISGFLLLLAVAAAGQDRYIGPYEAKTEFDSISTQKLARIRQQRVLFGSRSWGGAVQGSYIGNLGTDYALNWKSPIALAGTDTLTHNAFSSPGVVHVRLPDLEPARWNVFGDIIRGRNGYKEFGPEIDIACLFLYASSAGLWGKYHPLFDSLRNEYPNIRFGICTHHVASDSTLDMAWNVYGNEYSDSVMKYYRGVVPVIDLRMIAAIGPGGDTASFMYNSKKYWQLNPAQATPDHIHLTDYTTMSKSFFVMLDCLTPDTGAIDTTGIPVDSGMITVYVDPTASGAGDGSSWANAYTNLATAELIQRRDLTTANACITFKCRGGRDNAGVTFDTAYWKVDSLHYITVDVAAPDRHNGTRGTGYIIDPPPYTNDLYIKTPFTVIDGVALNGARNGRNPLVVEGRKCVIQNCLIYDVPATYYNGINLSSGAQGTKLVNNSIYQCGINGISLNYCRDVAIYNNTVLNCGRALRISNPATYPVAVKNCYFGSIAGDTVITISNPAAVTFTATHSSSGEYGTIRTALSATTGTCFTSVTSGAENCRISYSSALYSTGTDLGADPVFPFNYDAAGVFRNNGAYAVGAYEVAPITGISMLPGAGPKPMIKGRLYDLNGRPALGRKTGIYLMGDETGKGVKKVMIVR